MRKIVTMSVLGIGLAMAGCAQRETGSIESASLRGNEGNPHPLNEPFLAMTDSALMSDVAVVDMHFAPQSAVLTSLGLDRMARYAMILKQYGGVLRYDPQTADQGLIDARLTTLRQYLADAGLDAGKVSVTVGMAVEPGISGEAAVRALEKSRQSDSSSSSESTQGGDSASSMTGN